MIACMKREISRIVDGSQMDVFVMQVVSVLIKLVVAKGTPYVLRTVRMKPMIPVMCSPPSFSLGVPKTIHA